MDIRGLIPLYPNANTDVSGNSRGYKERQDKYRAPRLAIDSIVLEDAYPLGLYRDWDLTADQVSLGYYVVFGRRRCRNYYFPVYLYIEDIKYARVNGLLLAFGN